MRTYRCREFIVWRLFLQRQRRNVELKKKLCREVIIAKKFAVERFFTVF